MIRKFSLIKLMTIAIISLGFGMGTFLFGQTISEKKASLNSHGGGELDKESQLFLNQVNLQLEERKERLAELYIQAQDLYDADASECAYEALLEEISGVKSSIDSLECEWRSKSAAGISHESYALWHLPDTTLEQLIMEYGAQDYIYIIPPELAEMRISVNSNLPVPKGSWVEMLDTILAQSGVGIEQLNPYVRRLVLIKKDLSSVEFITANREELELYPRDTRVAFIVTPDVTDVRRLYLFIEKFANNENTFIQLVGRDILIVSQVGIIQELLKLYDFAADNQGAGCRDYLFVALTKIDANEMAQILGSIFTHPSPQGQRRIGRNGGGEYPTNSTRQ